MCIRDRAEEDGFTIYTQESNYDSDYDNSYNDTSYNDSSYNTDTTQDGSLDDKMCIRDRNNAWYPDVPQISQDPLC